MSFRRPESLYTRTGHSKLSITQLHLCNSRPYLISSWCNARISKAWSNVLFLSWLSIALVIIQLTLVDVVEQMHERLLRLQESISYRMQSVFGDSLEEDLWRRKIKHHVVEGKCNHLSAASLYKVWSETLPCWGKVRLLGVTARYLKWCRGTLSKMTI